MIVVKVELWSAVTNEKTELARMTICNVGGTAERGDYEAQTCRGRSATALARSMWAKTFTRQGVVTNHPRQSAHVWVLVAKALAAMGYMPRESPKAIEIPELERRV